MLYLNKFTCKEKRMNWSCETSGAGSAYPSEAPAFTPGFWTLCCLSVFNLRILIIRFGIFKPLLIGFLDNDFVCHCRQSSVIYRWAIIIHSVLSLSELTCFITDIYYWNLQFLNILIIFKTKVLAPPVYVI